MSVFRNQASGAYRRWEPPSLDAHEDEAVVADTTEVMPPADKPETASEPEVLTEPEAAEPAPPAEPPVRLPTAADIEAMYEDARQEGFAAGFEEGRSAGREQAARMTALVGELEGSIKRLDQDIADEIVALAIEIARQMVRHTLADHPSAITATVRAALEQLPQADARIYLHPDDATLVREYLDDELEPGQQLVEDDTITRGGCRVMAAGSEIDAQLETRWRRILAGLGRTDVEWQEED